MGIIAIPNSIPSVFRTAINAVLNLIDPLGTVKENYDIDLPNGYLWVNGCTIGDASSGATGRANADTIDLYTVLWKAANVTYSQIQLYTSSGSTTTKGATAAADFAAHKQLSLPDRRDRTAIGKDDMGGTSAGFVVADNAKILGGTGGEEKHTLIESELASHRHPIVGNASYGTGNAIFSLRSDTSDHSTLYSSYAGGGSAHNNMPPWVACNYIMRY
jgi:hypothetical protein